MVRFMSFILVEIPLFGDILSKIRLSSKRTLSEGKEGSMSNRVVANPDLVFLFQGDDFGKWGR
jgi:hypothetical protein